MRLVAIAVPLVLAACASRAPTQTTVSHGDTADGWLENGVPIADRGEGYIRARPGESTRFGTPAMVSLIERSAAEVARAFPGGAPLRVGDLSAPQGGRHSRHRSHRNGRDVDLIFYATDPAGRAVPGRGFVAYDRHGVGVVPPELREQSGEILRFDDARNWHLVRTMLLDREVEVQWIFCSHGVKARLLAWAAAHEPDPEALFRAAWILQQPSRGAPHDDHFHVRIACDLDEAAAPFDACRDRGPVWSWWRDAVAKRDAYAPLDDLGLVEALLDEAPDLRLAAR
ncbi:MAG: penicillin-insensitive murein endopeptidase [Myxococcales bacterium]|nr:penicillin-insensitive murein endopeptidase [Myxococcales bacterium]